MLLSLTSLVSMSALACEGSTTSAVAPIEPPPILATTPAPAGTATAEPPVLNPVVATFSTGRVVAGNLTALYLSLNDESAYYFDHADGSVKQLRAAGGAPTTIFVGSTANPLGYGFGYEPYVGAFVFHTDQGQLRLYSAETGAIDLPGTYLNFRVRRVDGSGAHEIIGYRVVAAGYELVRTRIPDAAAPMQESTVLATNIASVSVSGCYPTLRPGGNGQIIAQLCKAGSTSRTAQLVAESGDVTELTSAIAPSTQSGVAGSSFMFVDASGALQAASLETRASTMIAPGVLTLRVSRGVAYYVGADRALYSVAPPMAPVRLADTGIAGKVEIVSVSPHHVLTRDVDRGLLRAFAVEAGTAVELGVGALRIREPFRYTEGFTDDATHATFFDDRGNLVARSLTSASQHAISATANLSFPLSGASLYYEEPNPEADPELSEGMSLVDAYSFDVSTGTRTRLAQSARAPSVGDKGVLFGTMYGAAGPGLYYARALP